VGFSFCWRRRRVRRALLAALVALPLLAGGWLWLRDSPLLAVKEVRVSGVHGPDARAIDAALTGAARKMSTMHVRLGALRSAVAPFRVVRDVRVSASLPHALHIQVIEQLPVAALVIGGQQTAVAADGVVLGPALLSSALPLMRIGTEPLAGTHVRSTRVLADLGLLGAAPASLRRWISRVFLGPEGLTVTMRNGLRIYFGDATRPHAKWLSLARVLADPSAVGASYVDVRVPERPAADASGDAAVSSASTGSAQVSASDPIAAALAASLAGAVNGGSTSTGIGQSGQSAEQQETSAGASTEQQETSAGASTEQTPPPGSTSAPAAGG
jgi:cell division protein FtsQ